MNKYDKTAVRTEMRSSTGIRRDASDCVFISSPGTNYKLSVLIINAETANIGRCESFCPLHIEKTQKGI
jgi:hypothetical protein